MSLFTKMFRFLNGENLKLCYQGLHRRSTLTRSSFIKTNDICRAFSLRRPLCPSSSMIKLHIACKIALVNGGISGIGLATASQLLYAGARKVIITGRDVDVGKSAATLLNDTHGTGKASFVCCDVNCMAQFEEAFKEAYGVFNQLDIVVNSTGICNGLEWEREIVTNIIGKIRGTLLAYRYVGKEGMGKGGVIVNIAGVSGLEALPPAPTLCACEHAIVGLSRSFGNKMHTKKSGVRVVCVCPGFTYTDFIKSATNKGMSDTLGQELQNFLINTSKQKPEPCGTAICHVIEYGDNGSVWVCEGSKLFELLIPNRKSYSNLIAQYL